MVCVVSAQLAFEKDKLKEAHRLIREFEAKVGLLLACVALDMNQFNHNQIQANKEVNDLCVSYSPIIGLKCCFCMIVLHL